MALVDISAWTVALVDAHPQHHRSSQCVLQSRWQTNSASAARLGLTHPASLATPTAQWRGGSILPAPPSPSMTQCPPADSTPGPTPSLPTQQHPGRVATALWGDRQHQGRMPQWGDEAGKVGLGLGQCIAPARCSRNLPIRMGKRQVPSSHPGNHGKTQHDWPDRLGNSRKEAARPLCHGLEPPLWGEAPGRAWGCSQPPACTRAHGPAAS